MTGNSDKRDYGPPTAAVKEAQIALDAGNFEDAYRLADPHRNSNFAASRAKRVVALAIIRAQASFLGGHERAKAIKAATRHLYDRYQADPRDARVQAELAEALALSPTTWRAALAHLDELAAKDLLSEPNAVRVWEALHEKSQHLLTAK